MDPKSWLRSLFAAGDAGDLNSFADYLHEDVVVHAPAGLSAVGLLNEKDSWRREKAVIPDLSRILGAAERRPTVAARCIASGTLHRTLGSLSAQGRHVRVDQALLAHVRDGKIDELWEIVDTTSLLAQLGPTAGAGTTPRSD